MVCDHCAHCDHSAILLADGSSAALAALPQLLLLPLLLTNKRATSCNHRNATCTYKICAARYYHRTACKLTIVNTLPHAHTTTKYTTTTAAAAAALRSQVNSAHVTLIV
jgi:hypothetical protein